MVICMERDICAECDEEIFNVCYVVFDERDNERLPFHDMDCMRK